MGMITRYIIKAVSDEDDAEGGQKKQITNVSVADLLKDPGYEILDPLETARDAVNSMKKEGAEFIILLSGLSTRQNRKILDETEVDLVLGNDMCKQSAYRVESGGMRAHAQKQVIEIGSLEYRFFGKPEGPYGDQGQLDEAREELDKARIMIDLIRKRYQTEDAKEIAARAGGSNDAQVYKKALKAIAALPEEIRELEPGCEGDHFISRTIPVKGFVFEEEGRTGVLWREYLDSLSLVLEGNEEAIQQEVSEQITEESYVVEPKACAECHEAQYENWKNTAHGSAYKHVVAMHSEHHPRCFGCHSTGFNCGNGYIFPPPPEAFQSINCEICHGFLVNHQKDFIQLPEGMMSMDKEKLEKLCTYCHDKKHSPDFNLNYYLSAAACPKIDYNEASIRETFLERETDLERRLADNGFLEPPELYADLAYIKGKLGQDISVRIDCLSSGVKRNPYNSLLVFRLYPLLLRENRYGDALEMLEQYVSENQVDVKANLEIMHILIIAPDPEYRDPELGKKYCEWFLENLGNNREVRVLLCAAEIQLGNVAAAEEMIKKAETWNMTPAMRVRVDQMKKDLERLKAGN
jgi:hypothetical protein